MAKADFDPVVISDYPYHPKRRASFMNGPIKRVLDRAYAANSRLYAEIIARVEEYGDSLGKLSCELKNPVDPYWNNHAIPAMDGAMIYTVVAWRKPRLYFEIGSGNTTKFAARAIRDFKLPTRIVSIDPLPRAEIDSLCAEIIRKPLEDVPMSVFAALSPDDVLICDNSHRAFPNSDVTVFFTEILPQLPPALIYAIHDIALPDELWVERWYNEQYMLALWLLAGAAGDQIWFPMSYLARYSSLLDDKFIVADEGTKFPMKQPSGFFWMRRGGVN